MVPTCYFPLYHESKSSLSCSKVERSNEEGVVNKTTEGFIEMKGKDEI